MVQLSHPYVTTGKIIALMAFAVKVMSLLFNTLSRFVIAILPRSKRLLISWLQSPSAGILEPKKMKSDTVSTFSSSICHEVMGLKWTGMGEFNSDDHFIYYCWQESLRRNGVAIIVNKRVRNAVLGCNLKNDRMISVHFQGKPFNITEIQVYALTSNVEEAEVEQFYEDLQDLLELTPPKDVLSSL